jgi:hypothetical protein
VSSFAFSRWKPNIWLGFLYAACSSCWCPADVGLRFGWDNVTWGHFTDRNCYGFYLISISNYTACHCDQSLTECDCRQGIWIIRLSSLCCFMTSKSGQSTINLNSDSNGILFRISLYKSCRWTTVHHGIIYWGIKSFLYRWRTKEFYEMYR